ncbi:MAG: helix-turn-helix transcriptional regulator [Firmicutes bacterium]|nr:helix-turn-helix transcriptional regulator [Bacillota bacterium]
MEIKVGNHLKKFRFENGGISQEELAKAVGVSRQTIISIEKGKYMPSVGLAIKIAGFLKVQVEDIFYPEGAD